MIRTRLVPTLPAILLTIAVLAIGSTARAADESPHVVLICLDTVRADRLGCYGYRGNPTTPAIDRLAAEALVFDDTSSTACWTKPSVPTLFTGTYPAQHGVYEGSARGLSGRISHVLGDDALTLAELFAEHGYETGAFIRNAQLRSGLGFEQGFGTYVDAAGDAREIVDQGIGFLLDNAPDSPVFLYLHLLDAHMPYDVPDDDATRFTGDLPTDVFRSGDWRGLRDDTNDGKRTLSPDEQRALAGLYDGSIRYIDDQLARLFDTIEAKGLSGETIVCIVADHGEEFLEHGRLGHGHGLYENLLGIAWILRVPGRAPARVEAPVSLADVAPTLLAACGIRPGDAVSGVDRLAADVVVRPVFAEHKEPRAYVQSLRHAGLKLVRRFEPAPSPAVRVDASNLLARGGRWEAEVEPDGAGGLRATQLKALQEPADDPIEIKARATDVDGRALRLNGLPVRLASDVVVSGSSSRRVEETVIVREGDVVKVTGRWSGEIFIATKLKFYAPGAGFDPELRGGAERVELENGITRVRIGGVWIAFDGSTGWKDVETGAVEPHMSREQVVQALRLGGRGAMATGWQVTCRLYDLSTDPGEAAWLAEWPAGDPPPDPRAAGLLEELDRIGRSLLARRTWTDGDQAVLSDDARKALEELGYVR